MNIADREVGDIKNRRGIGISNMQNNKISQVTDEAETVEVNIGSNSHWAPPTLMRGYEIRRNLSTSISLIIQHHDQWLNNILSRSSWFSFIHDIFYLIHQKCFTWNIMTEPILFIPNRWKYYCTFSISFWIFFLYHSRLSIIQARFYLVIKRLSP